MNSDRRGTHDTHGFDRSFMSRRPHRQANSMRVMRVGGRIPAPGFGRTRATRHPFPKAPRRPWRGHPFGPAPWSALRPRPAAASLGRPTRDFVGVAAPIVRKAPKPDRGPRERWARTGLVQRSKCKDRGRVLTTAQARGANDATSLWGTRTRTRAGQSRMWSNSP